MLFSNNRFIHVKQKVRTFSTYEKNAFFFNSFLTEGPDKIQLRDVVLLVSCGGSDGLCRAQATDHRPHLLLRGQRQAKLLVSSKNLQDQLHLQVRWQRVLARS